MASGDGKASGDFLASQQGPTVNLKVSIRNTDLPSMNDILRAHGRFFGLMQDTGVLVFLVIIHL